MLVALTFINTLFAIAALALPTSKERTQKRLVSRLSQPKQTNITHPQLSTNWAGAVLNSDKGTYTKVTATFTVPTPQLPSGETGMHAASAWVGIDGDTCDTAILQTGLDFTVNADRTISYNAWYEWYPQFSFDFTDIEFAAGDSVTLTVEAMSKTSGSATVVNNSKNVTVTEKIQSHSALCEQDAEWIVEDFSEANSTVPFANFGNVTFTNVEAGTASGHVGPKEADTIAIEKNGAILTSTTIHNSEVIVEYKGNTNDKNGVDEE